MKRWTRRLAQGAAALGVMVALAACTGQQPRDRDGDGFDGTEDCHDADVAIHPNAVEVCDDGIDNDCDLDVDDADADCGE